MICSKAGWAIKSGYSNLIASDQQTTTVKYKSALRNLRYPTLAAKQPNARPPTKSMT